MLNRNETERLERVIDAMDWPNEIVNFGTLRRLAGLPATVRAKDILNVCRSHNIVCVHTGGGVWCALRTPSYIAAVSGEFGHSTEEVETLPQVVRIATTELTLEIQPAQVVMKKTCHYDFEWLTVGQMSKISATLNSANWVDCGEGPSLYLWKLMDLVGLEKMNVQVCIDTYRFVTALGYLIDSEEDSEEDSDDLIGSNIRKPD